MAKSKAHSYSSIKAFETCARQFHEVRVLKRFPFVETDEIRYGNRLHKAAELYVRDGKELEPEFVFIKTLLDELIRKAGAKVAEQELCVSAHLEPRGWWDADGYLRGKVDLVVLQPERRHAFVVDYKSGKDKYIDTDQLDICALLLFQHHPWLDVVSGGLLYVAANTFHRHTTLRSDAERLWQKYRERIAKIDGAFATDTWNPTQSGLCKKHCMVKECEFNGQS
jgi:hypothetical protein